MSHSFSITKRSSNPDSQVAFSRHTECRIVVDSVNFIFSETSIIKNVVSDPGCVTEVGFRVHDVSIHVVLEILRIHLVSDLRERLPGFKEAR